MANGNDGQWSKEIKGKVHQPGLFMSRRFCDNARDRNPKRKRG
jgi:hypothetical protein